MARLTQDDKHRISTCLINDTWTDKEIQEILTGLAKEVRKIPYIRKGIEIAKRYPEHVVALSYVNIKRNDNLIWRIPACSRNTLDIGIPIAIQGYSYHLSDHVNELSEKGQELYDRLIDYANGRYTFSQNVSRIMNAITTSKQLTDILPEAKKYIVPETDKAKMLVPKESIEAVRNAISIKEAIHDKH